MKVAVIQMGAGPDKAHNVAKAVYLVEQAVRGHAEFVLLPEMFNYRGTMSAQSVLNTYKEKIPGESIQPFMDLAKKHKISILAGSICEEIPHSDKVYNASVLIDEQGMISATYRKMHLFDAQLGTTAVKESLSFVAGQQPVTAKVGEFTVGLSVCYDVRFPDLYQTYARQGAQLLTVPSAFTKTTGQAHWEVLLRARAIENLCYVLAPNQIGKDGRGVEAYGHSMIVNPWGEILAVASADREEIITAELERNVLLEKRKILPGINKI